MKKITSLLLFVYGISYCQDIKHDKIIDLEPSMRIGVVMPIHFGNNMISNEFKNNIGFSSNFSFLKIYDLKLSFGFEYQKYNETNSSIGNISHINKYSYSIQSDYTLNLNPKYAIIPYVNYAYTDLNYKNSVNIIAKQKGNEIKIGSYLDYKLNNTYSIYIGFNYYKLINNIEASSQDKKYYGTSDAFQISFGIELN
ncbi:hypothetical protein [Flavobacterium cucumis]|uniref:Outer membrane protein beta-barrel domain-containing protein n=2 Tax=Flavobacterium cucumis TaxID=416016 RepID=A0A1M7ZVS6_9FLAO|nr:hypothetical protein [Flavobacterium cucumis]SHO72913.1 hypothetical protein SAMN05443547_1259 [Flavobacterium cucumis]